jgi:signal transduction histidine kinase
MSAATLSSIVAASVREPVFEVRGLGAIARARVENAGIRLMACAISAAVAASVLGTPLPLIWLAGFALVIWRERAIHVRLAARLAAGDTIPSAPLLAWTVFQSAYGNLLAVMLWWSPESVGATLAVVYLCGGLANAAATLRPSNALALAGAGPTIACLLGLPILDFFFIGEQNSLDLTPLVAALLLLGVGVNLWRSLVASDAAIAQAEIAHQREQRAAAAAAHAKSEMIARMNGELRAPLAALGGGVEHLRRVASTPGARAHAGALAQAAQALSSALDEVSDEVAAAAGASHSTDLRALMNGVANAFRPAIDNKRLELFVDIAPNTPARVEIDAIRVQRILFNLLSNAIRYTAHGGVRLRVSAAPLEGERVRLQFAVIDTGAGLSRSQLALISGRARSAENVRGAGLSICLRLAKTMGARLSARSEFGAGSAFALTLEAPICRNPSKPSPGSALA